MPTMFFGQNFLDKYANQEDVTSMVITKKMFELMGSLSMDSTDKDVQQYLNLIKSLDNLKVFSTANKKIIADMKSSYSKYMKSAGLEELMTVTENGKSIKIAVKTNGDGLRIKEMLMFMEGSSETDPTVLMSMTGNFELKEISTLTDRMNIPGGDELKSAAKKQKL